MTKRGPKPIADLMKDLEAQHAVEGYEPWQRKNVRRGNHV